MASSSKNQSARELARRMVRVIEIPDDAVVLICEEDERRRYEMFDQMRTALAASKKQRVLIVAAPSSDAMKVLSEKEMNTYGWFRIPEGELDQLDAPAHDSEGD